MAGSAYVGETIILSANDVGGIAGIGLSVLVIPILRRRFANIIRNVNAYLKASLRPETKS